MRPDAQDGKCIFRDVCPTGKCWGCGRVGHRLSEYHDCSVPIVGTDGSISYRMMEGGTKCGGGPLGGEPASRGGALRGGSVLGYLNRSRAPVGDAPMSAR